MCLFFSSLRRDGGGRHRRDGAGVCVAGNANNPCLTSWPAASGDLVIIDQSSTQRRAILVDHLAPSCSGSSPSTITVANTFQLSTITVATVLQGGLVYVGSRDANGAGANSKIYVCNDLTFATCSAVDFGPNSGPWRVSIVEVVVPIGLGYRYCVLAKGVVHICTDSALTTCSQVANLPIGSSSTPLVDLQENGGQFFIVGGLASGAVFVRCDNAALTSNCVALTPTLTTNASPVVINFPTRLRFANGKAYLVDDGNDRIFIWCGCGVPHTRACVLCVCVCVCEGRCLLERDRWASCRGATRGVGVAAS